MLCAVLLFSAGLYGQSQGPGTDAPYWDITVARDGSGDFSTLTEAIESLPMYVYQRTVILVKKGIYEEKVRIDRDYITLLGEDRDSTIIRFDAPRSAWQDKPDAIGPAVINIHADDIVLENLTVQNTQPDMDVHAFALYGTGTRTILLNCRVWSRGGDTVALWNYKEGMYYHADCEFRGAVDFICPRGWCYIDQSRFYTVRPTATLWHAGLTRPDQKLVVKNSSFDGADGFDLGRHHYEAQFYLINCTFSESMSDRPLYRVTYPDQPERNRPYFWGDRYYFAHNRSEGKTRDWTSDNLAHPDSVTAAWTFSQKWDPEKDAPLEVLDYQVHGTRLDLFFGELVSLRGQPVLRSPSGEVLSFIMGKGRDRLRFSAERNISETDLQGTWELSGGTILATKAYRKERILPLRFSLPDNP